MEYARDVRRKVLEASYLEEKSSRELGDESNEGNEDNEHISWNLVRIITGHHGWVNCIAMDPENQWYATGSQDSTIKLWNLVTGALKLTLTGHRLGVRDLATSERHPYLYSASEDKEVKCWDLETNSVVRNFHGSLSGVYSISVHPTLDLLVTGGRDSAVRVWDVRSRRPVWTLQGHKSSISSLATQNIEPQILSGSDDATVRLWDLKTGKTSAMATDHTKGIRSLCVHPEELSFVACSKGLIRQYRLPDADPLTDFEHEAANAILIDDDNLLGVGNNLALWNYFTGKKLDSQAVKPLMHRDDAELLCLDVDRSKTLLICGALDSSIRVWQKRNSF